jgi:putative ABC transport system substrate-binding protein
MNRRDFITLVGATAAWPFAARAQPARKPPTIGFLGSASASTMSAWTAAFVQRLREFGWIEGRTVAIEYRWGPSGRATDQVRSCHQSHDRQSAGHDYPRVVPVARR